MKNFKEINREGFMKFFRDDEKLNELTSDDRIEIFRKILIGSSDLTKELLEDVISDYCVSNLKVIDVNDGEE
jgi:putative ubiquitin-RnfH superfamily antitoxin RatB of RatAB toxin-antitoxin module